MKTARIRIPKTPTKIEFDRIKRRRANYWNRIYDDAGRVYGALYGGDPSYLAKRAIYCSN